MKLVIHVTQEDIAEGQKKTSTSRIFTCPIARAIKRETGLLCTVGDKIQFITPDEGFYMGQAEVPKRAKLFIEKADFKYAATLPIQELKPITFSLVIPDEIVLQMPQGRDNG